MRTTIVLDPELVADARRTLGGKSLRAMIEDSLREAIRKQRRLELARSIGTYDLGVSDEELALWRQDDGDHDE